MHFSPTHIHAVMQVMMNTLMMKSSSFYRWAINAQLKAEDSRLPSLTQIKVVQLRAAIVQLFTSAILFNPPLKSCLSPSAVMAICDDSPTPSATYICCHTFFSTNHLSCKIKVDLFSNNKRESKKLLIFTNKNK